MFFCVTSPFGTSWVSLFLADWSRFQAFLIFHFNLVFFFYIINIYFHKASFTNMCY